MEETVLSKEISSESRILGLIAWLLILIGPVAAILIKPEDDFVKFHAFHSLIFSICTIIAHVTLTTLSQIPVLWPFLQPLFLFVYSLIYIIWLAVALICGIKAYYGEWIKVPLVYEIAVKLGT